MTVKPLDPSANVFEEPCTECGAPKCAVKREDGTRVCTECIDKALKKMQEVYREHSDRRLVRGYIIPK